MMATKFVNETKHYGYQKEYLEQCRGEYFVIYKKHRKNVKITARIEEREAKKTCRYLEALNYGGSYNGNL